MSAKKTEYNKRIKTRSFWAPESESVSTSKCMIPTPGTRPVSSVGRLSTVDNQTHPDSSFDRQSFLYGRLSICFSSCIIHSCIFHHCYLLLLFPLLHIPPVRSTPASSTPAFSTPAFSASPHRLVLATVNLHMKFEMSSFIRSKDIKDDKNEKRGWFRVVKVSRGLQKCYSLI